MKNYCIKCNHEMHDNCHLQFTNERLLGSFNLIVDGPDYRKISQPLRSRYCPNCGHVEFYIDLGDQEKVEEKRVSNSYKEVVGSQSKKGQ